MSARKPLDPGCTGSLNCPVEGHLKGTRYRSGWNLSHIPLTAGQRKTLRERQRIHPAASR